MSFANEVSDISYPRRRDFGDMEESAFVVFVEFSVSAIVRDGFYCGDD